jgi:hypothetical protein
MSLDDFSSPDFRKTLDSLPPIEEYKEQVWNFLRQKMLSASPEEIQKKFIEAVKLYPQLVHIIEPEMIRPLRLYRVRAVEPNGVLLNERMVRSFSYPDPTFNLKNGRANLKGTSVFYCGNDWPTALRELEPIPGSKAYVSIWSIHTNRKLIYRAFLPHKSMPKESISIGVAKSHYAAFQEFNKEHNIDKPAHMEFLYDCLSECFTFPHTDYWLSSWMADNLIYGYNGIDFIMYPSWATQFVGTNYAFHPNVVDQFFKLEHVFRLNTKNISKDTFKYTAEAYGSVQNTNISWRGITKEDFLILERDTPDFYKVNYTPTK